MADAPKRAGRGRDKSAGAADAAAQLPPQDAMSDANGDASSGTAAGGRRGRGRQREPEAGAQPAAVAGAAPPAEQQEDKTTRSGKGAAAAKPAVAAAAGDQQKKQKGGAKAAAQAEGGVNEKGAVNDTVTSRVSMGDTVGRMSTVNIEEATAKDLYFDSYAHHNIHATMIKDQSRTQTYREAISRASDQIKGKIVLDVGCGTGMFSMWAIQAGAKHVYAVECSAIYSKTKEIFKANGHETDITLIHGRLEDITLPVDKVDVIMSEWMGFGLLHQSMLDTVIVARDKYLKPGGLMLPDKATLWMCGIEDATYKEEKLEYWNDVYGFDMSCVREKARCEPLVDIAPHDAICTKDCQISSFDMYTVTKEQLDFEAPFRLVVTRNDYLTAWVVFFDVGFTAMHPPLWLSTSPRTHPTHWCQAIFYVGEQLAVAQNEVVSGTIALKANGRNKRDLDFTISYKHKGKADGARSGSDDFQMR